MLGYISHPDCRLHDPGPWHPDVPERLDAINDRLIASGLDWVLMHYDAPKATREQLLRVHDGAYLDRVFAVAPDTETVLLDGDTVMSPGTLDAALRAAGAGVLGVDLIMAGDAKPVFCGVRPPGHHAEHDKAMGFCLFDNIAVAAAHAMARYGCKRVAIVDFDVHHGNGTEDIFRDDTRVLFCSAFQHPFYPFKEFLSETQHLIDVPLKAGSGSPEFRTGISESWLPALNAFRPEFVFISAGFDGHVLDDMSAVSLTESDYSWLTSELVKIARTHADGRILSMLEGGYELRALARSVECHLRALLD